MKKIQNILFTFLTLCLPFAMISNVYAADTYYTIHAEQGEVEKDVTVSDDTEQSLYDGALAYDNTALKLNNFKGEALELSASAGAMENGIILHLDESNRANYLLIESTKVVIEGKGSLKFVPANGKNDDNTPNLVTDKEEQETLLKSLIANYDDIKVIYGEDGYVIVSGLTGTTDAVESENGIIFSSDQPLDAAYTLETVEVEYTDEEKAALVGKGETYLGTYNIRMYNVVTDTYDNMNNGAKYKVKIPMTEEMKKFKRFKVVHVYSPESDKNEDMPTSVDGDYIVFETTHLSEYAVIGLPNEAAPNTFDGVTNSIILGMVALIGVGGVTIFLRKKVNEM